MKLAARVLLMSLVCSTIQVASAEELKPAMNRHELNRVELQLQQEAWATTTSAKVVVNLDASLDEKALAQAHQAVLDNLAKISTSGDWHITQFNRTKDDSGLEKLQVIAEARLPENQLADLRDKAKSLSKPGMTYTIQTILFEPSMDDIEKTKSALREKIYQQAKDEIARLNQTYPDQVFFIHKVDFLGCSVDPTQNKRLLFQAAVVAPAPVLEVSNRVSVQAEVVIASKINSASPVVANKK